jgi:EAL domain-containing protein (putative c-di-GMP-specific phosphodiesterase class I)
MNQIAHALGKQTVAECVENEATLQMLKEMGVDRAQGNFIGRPNPIPVSMVRRKPALQAVAETL